jgi:FtsP/CotA-like multicopper oxidase with cupredoxin domain
MRGRGLKLSFFGAALATVIVIAFVLVYPAPTPPGPDPDPAPAGAAGPCAFKPIDAEKYGNDPFRNPEEESSRKGRLDTTVTVKYTKRSKVSLAGCPLHLRSYNGGLFGNTLRVKAGDTLNLKLRNRLPKQSPREIEENFQQEASNAHIVHRPNPYNTTNVHYHGLHVSPRGNSDNVYLAIEPKTTFDYEVELPADHPPGTYWYHAHAHGSTAIQVASGMAGALIVEDDPQQIPAPLRAANKRDKVMLFQSILYDTDGETKEIEAFFPAPNKDGSDPACTEGLPTCTWQASHRRTTINGQIVPEIRMRPGEVQRWRMIDGTYRESLYLQLEGHALHEIALDGNYLGKVDTWKEGQPVHLEPGYRSDVLVKASEEPGTYDLTDAASSAEDSLRGVAEDENVVARVVVSGKPVGMDLPSDAQMASLAPFPDLANIANEATGVETAIFKVGGDPANSNKAYFTINYKAFALDNVRTVFLDHVDEWRLGTVGSDDGFPNPSPSPSPTVPPQLPPPHVFHIHVNPFLTFREGPDGKQEGVWKDTLLIQGDPVSVYTTYKDFTGKFVIHCHILDHEDLGMMEAVRVVRESSLNPEPVHDH